MGLTIAMIWAFAATGGTAAQQHTIWPAPRHPPRRSRPAHRADSLPGSLLVARAGLLGPLVVFLQLACVAELDVRLLPERELPGLGGAAALELGVELGAEQDREVGDPQPDQHDDHAGDAAVGLVVMAEVGHVEGEQRG